MHVLAAGLSWIPLLVPLAALAAPGAYTDPATFAAQAPGPAVGLDLEGLAAGSIVSGLTLTTPATPVGVVLPAAIVDALDPTGPALELRVVADPVENPASSGSQSLGVADPGNFDAFAAGSSLAFAFSQPIEAFGLVLVTPEEPGAALFDGDARLTVPGEAAAALALADGASLGTFGGREYRAYFLGVVASAPFTQAQLGTGPMTPASGFFFNVDDLVIAVPEPGGGPGLVSGGLLLAALRRRRIDGRPSA